MSCISIELQSEVLWHKFGHLVALLGGQFAHLLCRPNVKGAVKYMYKDTLDLLEANWRGILGMIRKS